ncbi:MAG: RNA polymerase sigma factor [Caldisericia bacterium]|nr:RNA polymerase sigma factor [Caldisericia bacterium]MDD4613992.1 RNA polymerase sigma factor [Caldisericia bacterium]
MIQIVLNTERWLTVIEIDREILQFAKDGDRMAQAEVFSYYKNYVFRSAFFMLKNEDEADDIVENVFFKVFSNFVSFDMTRSFHPWLSRIILNETRTYIKKNRRAYTNQDFVLDNIPSRSSETKEKSQQIQRYMKELSPKDRELITMRYFQELTIEEIARIVNISVANAKVRIHRATKKLKQIIETKEEN